MQNTVTLSLTSANAIAPSILSLLLEEKISTNVRDSEKSLQIITVK